MAASILSSLRNTSPAMVPDRNAVFDLALSLPALCSSITGTSDQLHRNPQPALVDNATAALSRLTAPPLTISFDQIGSFGNRQAKSPLVLAASDGNEQLHMLHKQLAAHLRASSLGQWTHGSYTPHMTVAYGKATMPFEKIEPISWAAGEVLLIHSLLGKTRHIPMVSKLLA